MFSHIHQVAPTASSSRGSEWATNIWMHPIIYDYCYSAAGSTVQCGIMKVVHWLLHKTPNGA